MRGSTETLKNGVPQSLLTRFVGPEGDGGSILFVLVVTDGANYQTIVGQINWVAFNSCGKVNASTQVTYSYEDQSYSLSTLEVNATTDTSTPGYVVIDVTAQSSLLPTSMVIQYKEL